MWLDDLLADSQTTTEAGAIANAEMQRDPAQPPPSDEPVKGVVTHDTLRDAVGLLRKSVREESATSGEPPRMTSADAACQKLQAEVTPAKLFSEPRQTSFVVQLPGRDPFGVACPQGCEAVRAQWPTATSITPS